MARLKTLLVVCLLSLLIFALPCRADMCEFDTIEKAKEFGWEVLRETSVMEAVTDSTEGSHALKVAGQDDMGLYGGIRIRFRKSLDLTRVNPDDKISFYIKQNFTTGFTINVNGGGYHRSFPLKRNEWTKVELEMDIAKWETKNDRWEEINWIEFYSRSFDSSGKEMLIDGLRITVDGKEAGSSDVMAKKLAVWTFPSETDTEWLIGNDAVSWSISKKTGEITGGWNVKTKEPYLNSGRARYYLEDKKTSWKAQEEDDAVFDAKFDRGKQEITIKCKNPSIPGVEITKRYRLDGTRFRKETVFASARKEDIFITLNSEVYFDKEYRKDSYYMGAGFVGPLIPAPQVAVRRRVTEHQNTTKSMILSQPVKRYSFAHYRLKLDDKFVFPWWTNSIIGYNEEFNALFYTPNGWEMSMGTSKIPAGGRTSCEELFHMFGGDWYDFYTTEYPAIPEVKEEIAKIPPVPEWMQDVIADGSADYNQVKRLVETTDKGYIMVLLCPWGSWADYYVNEGLAGFQGGFITGPELKEYIQRLQSISPRVKVGIYSWMASASYESRIFAKHPEWFRQRDKQGNPVYLFPGVSPNYSSMINRKDCYDEILHQYDLILGYLNTDFIYIDEGRNHNVINWATGDVSRDDHFYEFYLDVKKTAAKHGPDRVLFLNGRGNLYGDVNYIEARGQLRAGYWRNFAGMGLGMEALLKNLRPTARIIPLFWTPPLARDYVNRTIAMGWIPATQYVDAVEQRPFITAAYEMGRLTTVNMDYSPDWKKDASTNLESYPMRRETDEYLLSLINNEEKARTFEVKINLNSLELDKNRNIAVRAYRVENALEFKGQTSEKVSREIYRTTGWKMDMATRPELLYLGKYTSELILKIPLNPLELTVIEITDKSAGLYSVEGLPCNFYLSGQKGIKLTETASGVRIDSEMEEAEVVIFIPAGKEAKNIKLNKKTADYELVDIAGNLFPVLKVSKGKGQFLEIAFGDTAGKTPAGKIRELKGEKPVVKPEALGLTPKKADRMPETKEITPINRTVKGINVLNKAIHTGGTTFSGFQRELKPFAANADVDNLILEAGTTRKIEENQGQAFAGIEIEGVKRIELKLTNTYKDAFHLRSPRMHTHQYAKSHNEFAGFMVDYHTDGGYTKRVALGVGVMDTDMNTGDPAYGKNGKPDMLVDLGDLVNESKEKTFTIDLASYAPEGWDGRAWFSVGSNSVAANRRLTAEILNVNENTKAGALAGTKPGEVRELFLKPKSMTVPKASPSPVIDGVVDEEIWQSAVVIDRFFLVGGKDWPRAKTRAVLLYDNDYLYVGFTCEETARKVPITGKGNIWDGDEAEVLIDVNSDAGKTFHQIIVSAVGEKLELTEGGVFNGGTKAAATREEGRSWTVEMAIPFKGLGLESPKSGDKWKFNLARYRPGGEGFEAELIVWSSMEGWFLEFDKMGELIFK